MRAHRIAIFGQKSSQFIVVRGYNIIEVVKGLFVNRDSHSLLLPLVSIDISILCRAILFIRIYLYYIEVFYNDRNAQNIVFKKYDGINAGLWC